MTPEELEEVRAAKATTPTVSAADLAGQKPRTLIYGYDVGRITWHVYWDGEDIVRHIYTHSGPQRTLLTHSRTIRSESFETKVWDILDLVPNKRVYWEASDGWFCRLLTLRGAWITFTSRGHWDSSDFIGEL